MSTSARRWWLAAAAAIAALLTLASIAEFLGWVPYLGVWGATFGSGERAYSLRVLSVDEGSAAAKAGLQPGDVTDLRRYSLLDRYGLLQAPLANRPVHFMVERNGRFVALVGVPTLLHSTHIPQLLRASNRAYHGGLLLMCIFAGLIAWRGYKRLDACILSLMLSVFVVGEVASPFDIVVPWPALAAFLEFISEIAYVLPIALFATFASAVAPPLTAPRKAARAVTYALAGAALVIALGIAFGQTFLRPDPVGLFYQPVWTSPQNLAYIAALVAAVMAFGAASGRERQLVGWAASSAAVLFITQIIATLGEEYATTSAGYVAFEIVGNIGVFVAPAGLTYALLTHRLMDIAFVLNRAVVFTGVSLVVVGMFTIVEFALGEWIRDASHLAGTAVNIAVALAVGFSIRPIHMRVDHFVDTVFFRKRYEDEEALRKFAREAAYITSPNVLLERAVRTVEEHTDASSVSLLLTDDTAIDPDDEALVAMRTSHEPIELSKYETMLKGEYAFPMSSRGKLLGALLCGPNRGGDAYAPDEFSAIAQLAHGVGTALDMLQVQEKGAFEALLEAQREMLNTLREIRGALLTNEPVLRLQK